MALTNTMAGLISGRVLAGIATGIASMNVPLYISEICPIQMRGRVIAIYSFLVVFGQFFSLIMGFVLLTQDDDGTDTIKWRILVSIGVIVAVIQLFGVIFLPDSPRWLANKGRNEKA